MTFNPERVDSAAKAAASQFTYKTELEADLATGIRGGNKARLVARIYVALENEGKTRLYEYATFRAAYIKKTFAQLHEEFDFVLPVQYRAK